VSNFGTIVVGDFEYEVAEGELPNVLCAVFYVLDEHLRHTATICLWRGEFNQNPPFDIGPDSVFVAYSAWAEMTCFQVLGWKFPQHIFDCHTAFLATTNVLRPHDPDEVYKRPRKRLSDADAYQRGDVYYAFARAAGLTHDQDHKHWKKHSQAQRQQMKQLQLALNYGMGVASMAKGINRHPLIASALIERHRRIYPRFWQWRGERVERAMLERRIETVFGWPLHLSTSPNPRTLYNFPMQGNGSEMLRLATTRLCDAGIVPVMLIHDGILFEVSEREQIEHAIEIMRSAGRDVCDGFEIGVDVDQLLESGERYRDKRDVAQAMWDTVMGTLRAVQAIPTEKTA
jgi:hypothetical protein